jgi:hypothetical protein
MAEPSRVVSFNTGAAKRFPKKPPPSVAKRDDFDEIKEADIVEICRTADLPTKNRADLMRDKLRAPNRAAHPSSVVITGAQADDVVSDLVNNIVLALR